MVAPNNPTIPDTGRTASRFLADIRRMRANGESRNDLSRQRERRAFFRSLEGQLRSLDDLEAVSAEVGALAEGFVAETPGFRVSRRFFDGRYMIELAGAVAADDGQGGSSRELSRLAVLISLEGRGEVLIEVHQTVRDHDLPTARHHADLRGATGLDEAATFLDEEFLQFAKAFYGDRPGRAA